MTGTRTDIPEGHVRCRSCGTDHEAFSPETQQADGCAAFLHGDEVTGHYGSEEIDLETWTFVPGAKPEGLGDGPVCDPCVRRFREGGLIAKKSDNDAFTGRPRRTPPEGGEGEAEAVVSCDTCGKEYRAIFPVTRQGHRCAATVHGDMVTGHYGSTVIDMERWRFLPGKRPETVKDGIICDPCVEGLRDSGAIAVDELGVW